MLTVAEVDHKGAVHFLEVGRALTERLGRPPAAADLTDEDVNSLGQAYHRCARKGEPCYEHLRFDFGDGEPTTFERLLVPFSSEGGAVTHLVGISVFSGRTTPPDPGNLLAVR